VVVHHVRNLFFVDYSSIAGHPSVLLAGVYALTGLGRQAVMVFFVLSGFLIATIIDTAWASRQWSVEKYVVRRLSRLLVVLLPALLLTLVLDRAAVAWLPGAQLYTQPPAGEAVLNFSAAANDGPLVLVGNIAFLQGILVPPFGSNAPLWSLAYELWYYVAFPLFYFAAARSANWPIRAVLGVAGLGVLVMVGTTISLYFVVWLMGAAVALVYRRWGSAFRPPTWLVPVSALLLAVALVAGHLIQAAFLRDLTVGIAFTMFLVSLRFSPPRKGPALYAALASWLAGAAYTIYLVHFPILLFLRAWLQPRGQLQPNPSSVMVGLALFACALGIALVFAHFTERRTNAVRSWVERQLVGVAKPAQPK
jgi:peptidoglycan/LPS O-acetylase OafA/YrhL